MLDRFEVAAGGTAGRHHLRAGRGSQDAFGWLAGGDALAAVVCDGCGSAPHSEVGARVLSRIAAEELLALLQRGLRGGPLAAAAREAILARLGAVARALGAAAADYLLSTLVAAAVAPDETSVLSCGDGLLAVDGEPQELGPFENNEPPYLAYALFSVRQERSALQVVRTMPTSGLTSLVLGTDGALDLWRARGQPLADRTEQLPSLAALTADARLFANADGLRRRLSLLAREPFLVDDTTLVLLRRRA